MQLAKQIQLNSVNNILGAFLSGACDTEVDPPLSAFTREDLVMKIYFCGHSSSSADSRKAIVSYWRKNAQKNSLTAPGTVSGKYN